MRPLAPAALALLAALSAPALAQAPGPDAPARDPGPAAPAEAAPPPPLAVEAAAYVYAAANICGFQIDPAGFDRLLTARGSTAEQLRLQGPFGGRIRTRFVVLSNRMAQDRNAACAMVWREIGAEGTIAAGVVLEGPARP